MAKFAAKAANLTVNSVALEDDLKSITLDIKQEVPEVTSLADAGPRRVTGNYDWSEDVDGFGDFASGQSDATLFGLLGAGPTASDFDPTGTAAGANNPHYTGSIVLESYSIKASVGGAVEISAKMPGASALTRAVA